MKQLATFVLILMFSVVGYAQTDTLFADSPLNFYPLNVGDERQYKKTFWHFIEGATYTYFIEKVLKDTIISGLYYKKLNGPYNQYFYERIDSLSWHVYSRSENQSQERLLYCLKAEQGDSCGTRKCYVGYKLLFGQYVETKEFSSSYWGELYWSGSGVEIAAKLGKIKSWSDSGDMYTSFELVYASINGIKYGTLIQKEDPPEEPDSTISPPENPDSTNNDDLQIFQLFQNYPNPFNSSTKISFNLSSPAHVQLDIYNTQGKIIKSLINKNMPEGNHIIEFSGTNLSSGIFLYRLRTDIFCAVKKMIYLK
jgi:hypothetical protein